MPCMLLPPMPRPKQAGCNMRIQPLHAGHAELGSGGRTPACATHGSTMEQRTELSSRLRAPCFKSRDAVDRHERHDHLVPRPAGCGRQAGQADLLLLPPPPPADPSAGRDCLPACSCSPCSGSSSLMCALPPPASCCRRPCPPAVPSQQLLHQHRLVAGQQQPRPLHPEGGRGSSRAQG